MSLYSNGLRAEYQGFKSWYGQEFSPQRPDASGAHPASYSMGNGGEDFLRGEADLSHPSSAEVKNGGAVPPLPYMSSWHGA
jgi:hypothetical protein